MSNEVLAYLNDYLDDAVDDLRKIIAYPSVAAKGEQAEETAEHVKQLLESASFQAKIHPTDGAPVVTGEIDVGARRTILFYDHYDVQPAEPFELWDSDPFQLEVRDGRIYGRGVADNKGDLVSRVWAIKAYTQTNTDLGVNVKIVVEGEEEIGSVHLPSFTKANTEFLKADGGIWEFGGSDMRGKQEAWLGLKGILLVQLEVECLSHDAHSSLACVLPSAAYRLTWALASLKDPKERVQIEGFYERASPLTDAEMDALARIDLNQEMVKEFYGIDSFLLHMSEDELKEAYYNAPTCNICGLDSGYQGEGSKTVLPAKAIAKIDFRLVVGMDHKAVLSELRRHLDAHGFQDVKITMSDGYPAAKTPIDHPFVNLVSEANKKIFGHPLTVHLTSPGSGPLYLFKDLVPMVSIGCGDFYSRVHSPNESILFENFDKSMKRIAVLLDMMSTW